jgi:Tetratricopeptide repeat
VIKWCRSLPPASAGVLTCTALSIVAVVLAFFPVHSEDIGWHIRVGQAICRLRGIPPAGLFVHSLPPETAFRSSQWLFQVLTAGLYELAGWAGIAALRIALAAFLACVLTLRLINRAHAFGTIVYSVSLVLVCSRFRITDRPEMFSFLFLAFQLGWWSGFLTDQRPRPAWLLISQLLWVNFHSSAVLGCLMAVLAALLCAIPRGTKPIQFNPWMITAAIFATTMVNPNGWYVFLFGAVEGQKKYITENLPAGSSAFTGLRGLLIALAATGLWNRRITRKAAFESILLFLFLVQSVLMVRFFPYFAIAAVSPAADGIQKLLKWSWPRRVPQKLRTWTVHIVLGMLIVASTAVIFHADRLKQPRLQLLDFSRFPEAAADFILRENIQGNIYNSFNEGGYLLWRFYPNRQVMIFNETRLNAVLLDRMIQMRNDRDIRSIFDEFDVTHAVIYHNIDPVDKGSSLAGVVRRWPEWKLTFWDDNAMVLVKDLPGHRDLISKYGCVVNPENLPSRNNLRADTRSFLALRKDPATWQQVRTDLERAAESGRGNFRAVFGLGLWHDAGGSTPTVALQYYKKAEETDPGVPELLNRMGQWYLRQQDFDKAIAYMERAAKHADSKPNALYNLAVAQRRAGRLSAARRTLKTVLKMQSGHAPAKKLLLELEEYRL